MGQMKTHSDWPRNYDSYGVKFYVILQTKKFQKIFKKIYEKFAKKSKKSQTFQKILKTKKIFSHFY